MARYSADGSILAATKVPTRLDARFLQSLPGGRFLLVQSRARADEPNAEIWTTQGRLERETHLGDALSHVLDTASGDVWVGYFDEAMSSDFGAHGLVRFDHDLRPVWSYDSDSRLCR